MDQMHLAEVRLARIGANPRAVLYGSTHMGIAFDPEPFEQAYLVEAGLRKAVAGAGRNGGNPPENPVHAVLSKRPKDGPRQGETRGAKAPKNTSSIP
jgi:hypothetical protein